ncbi:hypothetical protein C0J52_16399 [Blattella germanica]|nr:hypothetical protein C0J52_16399 [Blattella germanica]
MSTFCRITGKSRGLPKPNYFPLLPPISPADAKRFCRITGKSYGLPGHHFIPVMLISKSKKNRVKCKITENEASHKFAPPVEARDKRRRHMFLADYRYVFPVLDGESETQKLMNDLLATKNGSAISFPDEDSRFVYTVQERRCSLVFTSAMEAAVRDGDIRDVMLAKESDIIVFKLKKGNEISIDFKTVKPKIKKDSELYEGDGPSAEVLKEIEKEEMSVKKRKRKRPEGLDTMKKIFEEKEKEAEEIVEKEIELAEMKKAKVIETENKTKESDDDVMTEEEERAILNDWRRFDPRHSRAETSLLMCSGDWRDLIKPLIEDWDWDSFESEAEADSRVPIITTLPEPVPLQAQLLDLGSSSPGIVQSQNVGAPGEISGFEPIPSVAPFTPLIAEPDKEVQNALVKLQSSETLAKTCDVKTVLVNGSDSVKAMVPKVNEIPDLVSKLETGVLSELGEEKGAKVQGLIIDIDAAKRFVAGQNVETPNGLVFVPGQTLQTPSGPLFVPGFTVKTPGSDTPVLIPGQKVLTVTEESGGTAVPVFVAGQTLTTREGEKFVPGQTVQTAEGPRFMAGQTVLTPDGPKFIPGQLVMEKENTVNAEETKVENGVKECAYKFVPGQTVMTSKGPKFVPGQTVATAQGEEIFIAGQSVQMKEGEWEFVPGQTVEKEGEMKFVAGQTVMTPDGPKFIPGQVVKTEKGSPQFVPGVTIAEDGGSSKFVPGKIVQTPDGTKFVEGQLLKTPTGVTTFVPGKTEITNNRNINFAVAKKLDDIVIDDVIKLPEEGLKAINPCPGIVPSQQNSTSFGHVVQTSHGVEFFPGQVKNGLPAGKIVPGKLERGVDGHMKFVPGTVIEIEPGVEKFVPGQVVVTEQGEQFVPGQVVETSEGTKFVPGQVVDTITGQKFVPGQTMETNEGTKFVPGQIVDTKAGPTFIPGQVISTEEGSKFVPGEVVDTAEGPRFVPGRVHETEDNKVKFVPGQIVQTKDGTLRFIAPDLQDTPEGDFEFSVQGFEITPEELQILRPIQVTASYIPTSGCEMSIDSRMLKQLSEAGMSLGRQVSLDLPKVDVKPHEVKRVLHRAKINKVDILKDICSEQHSDETLVEKLSAVLKQTVEITDKKESDKNNTRVDTLQSAFKHLSQGNPAFLERVMQKVSEHVEKLDTEKGAVEAVQRAIVSAVKESSERRIQEMLQDEVISVDKDDIQREDSYQGGLKGLLLQAVGLARALGMSEVVSGLLEVLSDPQSTQLLAHDELTMDILRRLTVMRQLAEQNPSLCLALRKLQNDPDIAKADPRLRELVRESAALMVVPEEDYLPLQSSKDIPNTLLHSNNILAMEDFLFSRNTRSTGTLLILKHGIQCIIPRENARGVLTGQIAYTVLDENGIRHFEPLHVFSALRLPKQAAHHWRIYSCPIAKEEKTSSEFSSTEDLYTNTMTSTSTTTTRRGNTLDSGDGSTLNYTRLNGYDDTTAQSITSGYNTPTSRYGSQYGKRRGTLDSTRSISPQSGYTTPTSRINGGSPVSGETTPTYRGKSTSYRKFSNALDLGSEIYDVYVATQDFRADEVDSISLKKGDAVEVLESRPETVKRMKLDPELDVGTDGMALLDSSAAKHKLAVRPRRKHADPRQPQQEDASGVLAPGLLRRKTATLTAKSVAANLGIYSGIATVEVSAPLTDTLLRCQTIDTCPVVISFLIHIIAVVRMMKYSSPTWLVRLLDDPSRQGWVPAYLLMNVAGEDMNGSGKSSERPELAAERREELVETEEEFGRDLQQVVEHYLKPLDSSTVPRIVRDNKEVIFSNLKQIAEFHNSVLIEGVKYYASEPRMLGRTFLRLVSS